MRTKLLGAASGLLLAATCAGAAVAAPVDLSTWAESNPLANGNWVLAPDDNSVTQTINGNPTIYYSTTDDQNVALSGSITVQTGGDDDFIGFVLGYGPEDEVAGTTDFILVDWKQNSQGSFGCTAFEGLSISHVTAPIANNSGAWCHEDNGVTELARANTLGSTGWNDNEAYEFEITFTDSLIEVLVNGILELSIIGTFSDGSFGFYNYSQANVLYAGITSEVIPDPTPEIPVPGALPLMASALAGFGLLKRKKKKA